MPAAVPFVVDFVAIATLAYGIYFRRHQRRDMFLAYVALNLGVMCVAAALDRGAGPTVALGLGLFGVLSIIRLRSDELPHEEVAYYFVSLAMGMLAGVRIDPDWLSSALIAAIVVVMFLADHPRMLAGARRQMITLDGVYADESEARRRVEALLGAPVRAMQVRRIDLVQDQTTVDVRYRLPQVVSIDATVP